MTASPPEPDPPIVTGDESPVLPDQTRDDLAVGWGDRADDPRDGDERFLRERPPHWE